MPDDDIWDTHCESYDNIENSFLYFRGELIYPHPDNQMLKHKANSGENNMFCEHYVAEIYTVIYSNEVGFFTEDDLFHINKTLIIWYVEKIFPTF